MEYRLRWTEEAVRNLEDILFYLENRWTRREVAQFKVKLGRLLDIIQANPFIFPVSAIKNQLRKAVLSPQTTVFYEISGNLIYYCIPPYK